MHRPERLAEILKEEISEVVGFELDDPRLEAVDVTDIEVSPDRRDANVYVFVHGSENEIEKALKTLQHASAFVRQQVALNLELRHVPHLHFIRDAAEKNAVRVNEILEEMTVKGEFKEK